MKLQIRILGPPDISLGGVTVPFSRRKTEALFYYLAGRGGDLAAVSAASLLWPEFPPDRARASLRRALSDSAQTAGRHLLERRGRMIGFAGELEVSCDALDFASLSRHGLEADDEGMLAQSAALYRGEFLEGFYLDDALLFEDWQLLEAECYRTRAADVLARLVEKSLAAGRLAEAEERALHLSELAPLSGVGHRLLMELAWARGDTPEALRCYEAYARLLDRELGARPDKNLGELRLRISSGEKPPLPRREPPGDHDGGDAPGSSRRAEPSPGAAGKKSRRDVEIGNWLIDTTCTRAGFQAAREHFLRAIEEDPNNPEAWLGVAKCRFGQLFLGVQAPSAVFPAIFDDIARGRAASPRHPDLLAFEAFTRSLTSWEWERAEGLFKVSRELDPGSPDASFWYANYLSTIGEDEEALRVAAAANERAPSSLLAAFSLAIRFHYLGHDRESLEICADLVERKPDYWLAFMARGWSQLSMGWPDKAADSFAEAARDGGFEPRIFLCCALSARGRMEEAREQLARADQAAFERFEAPFLRGLAFAYLGETALARSSIEQAIAGHDYSLPFRHSLPLCRTLPEDSPCFGLAARIGLDGNRPRRRA